MIISTLILSLVITGCAKKTEPEEAAEVKVEAQKEEYFYYGKTEGLVMKNLVGSFKTAYDNGKLFLNVGSIALNDEDTLFLGFIEALPIDVTQDNLRVCTYAIFYYTPDKSLSEDDVAALNDQFVKDRGIVEDSLWKNLSIEPFTTSSGCTIYLDKSLSRENSYYGELTDEDRALFESMWPDVEAQLAEIDIREPMFQNMASSTVFSTTDYDGNEIDSTIFADADITMVNAWASFCSPCIGEMPELQKLSDAMKDKGVQVITVLFDAAGLSDTEVIEDAHTIMEQSGVDLPVLLANNELKAIFPVAAFPTSFLVDRKGNIVGTPVIGSRSKDLYEKWVQSGLDSLNK